MKNNAISWHNDQQAEDEKESTHDGNFRIARARKRCSDHLLRNQFFIPIGITFMARIWKSKNLEIKVMLTSSQAQVRVMLVFLLETA